MFYSGILVSIKSKITVSVFNLDSMVESPLISKAVASSSKKNCDFRELLFFFFFVSTEMV